jgi:hypothetical protein
MKTLALLAALALGVLIPRTAFAEGGACTSCVVDQPDNVVLPPTPEDHGCLLTGKLPSDLLPNSLLESC